MLGLVLVIEDEVDLATTLEYNLTAEGFQVRLAHSGRQGLASATADPLPDVIVLDLMLPDLSGTEICRRLREAERTRDIPVVMCTAKGRGDRSRRRLRGRRRMTTSSSRTACAS